LLPVSCGKTKFRAPAGSVPVERAISLPSKSTLATAGVPDSPLIADKNALYTVDAVEVDWSDDAENIYFRFNILDKRTEEKALWADLKKEHIEVISDDDNLTVKGLSRLLSAKGYIPENILVLLLVDRSVHNDDMDYMRNAVSYIINMLPEKTVYIAFFDPQPRSSLRITADNFDIFQDEFTITKNDKTLFDAALVKFRELCGEKGLTTDQQLIDRIGDGDIKKYLVLLTDGRVNVNNLRTADNIQRFSEYVQQLDNDITSHHRVEIHAIRYGEVSEDVDQTLSYLCVDIRNENVKGGFYIASPESFIEKLKVSDKDAPDYELTVHNPDGVFDNGFIKDLIFHIQYEGKTAYGQTAYTIGTLLRPVRANTLGIGWRLALGFAIWLIVFGLLFCIVQIVIPFVRFDVGKFERKFVRRYSFDDETVIQCHYCLNEIMDGEEIVTKCQHTVHKNCWIENGCKCADYGESCKEGKQYFFDMSRPFNRENRPYYTPFAWYGLLGGLITWMIYQLLIHFFPHPFEPFIRYLIPKFYPGYEQNPMLFLQLVYLLKTSGFLIVGILIGFIPVYIIANLHRIRQRNITVWWVLLKSILGAAGGFLSFLTGVILIFAFQTAHTGILLDWIPWILSGCVWGMCLSLRENVLWKQVIMGGMLAGLLCFVILFLGRWWGSYAVLLGFMALGAVMGVSFISARRTVYTYFLKYQGQQSGKIAIHKWMSVAGGSEEVTIGKSKDCTICMDWDNHSSLRPVNVKMYIDKKYSIPCLKVMDEHIVYDRIIARKHDEYILQHGIIFKIGDTTFQYIEKSK